MHSSSLDSAQTFYDRGKLRLYRQIFENSPDGIAIIDPAGYYLEQNAAHHALTGYSAAELVGRTPAIHLGEATFREIAQELVRTGHYYGEHESRNRDGSIRAIDLSAFAVYDEHGNVECYIGRKRDITERKRAETALQHRYDELEAIYRMTAAVSRANDLAEIYEEALTSLESALGCQRSSVLLFDHEGVMRFRAWHNLSAGYRHAVEGHSPWAPTDPAPQSIGVDDVQRAADLIDFLPVLEAEGIRALAFIPLVSRQRLLGKFMLYFDRPHAFRTDELQLARTIANQIAFSIERQRGADELKRAHAAKSAFLATMSHELRTPLNAILGYSDLLNLGVSGELNPAQRAHIQRIDVSARHLLDVIEDILTFSRAEARREEVHIENLDLASFIAETVAMVEPLARQKHLALRVVAEQKYPAVRNDPRKLRQILLNLLSNAVKFTEHGEVVLEVQLTPDRLRFVIADTGPGISPEHRELIFEPFWQVHQGETRRVGGTGLGLTVARQLVELLRGGITVESRPGGGTRFIVEFNPQD